MSVGLRLDAGVESGRRMAVEVANGGNQDRDQGRETQSAESEVRLRVASDRNEQDGDVSGLDAGATVFFQTEVGTRRCSGILSTGPADER